MCCVYVSYEFFLCVCVCARVFVCVRACVCVCVCVLVSYSDVCVLVFDCIHQLLQCLVLIHDTTSFTSYTLVSFMQAIMGK